MPFVEPVLGEASGFDFESRRSTKPSVVASLLPDSLSALATEERCLYSLGTSGDTFPSTCQLSITKHKEPIPGK